MIKIESDFDKEVLTLEISGSLRDVWCEFASATDAMLSFVRDEIGPEEQVFFLELLMEYLKDLSTDMERLHSVIEQKERITIDLEAFKAIKALKELNDESDPMIDYEAERLEGSEDE